MTVHNTSSPYNSSGECQSWELGSPAEGCSPLQATSAAGNIHNGRSPIRGSPYDERCMLKAPSSLNSSYAPQHHQQSGFITGGGRGNDGSPARGGRFIEDLLVAENSLCALDRYKALIRLMSHIKRRMAATGINLMQMHEPQSWEGGGGLHVDLLRQILLVGESLARLGTAEFGERSNSSRAINTKDYATLLQQFLEAHGPLLAMEFIASLPPNLQDESLTVRTLLQTRCESNSIIFGQLVKQIGVEPQSGSLSTVVYNSSALNSKSVTVASSNPTASANVVAKAEVMEKKSVKFGLLGAATFLGLWVLKGRLFGGGRSTQYETNNRYNNGGSRRRQAGEGGALGLVEKLMDTERFAERLATQQVAVCAEQLQRAKRNAELLTHDWRLGTLRLGGGVLPPGYEPLEVSGCSLKGYLGRLPAAVAAGPHHHHGHQSSPQKGGGALQPWVSSPLDSEP